MAYKDFFKELDEMARGAFAEYNSAESAYKAATERKNDTPVKQYCDPVYAAKAARAASDYAEAEQAFSSLKWRMQNDYPGKVDAIRKRLAAEIEASNMANPADIDQAIMELIRSGILTASEYRKLLDTAQANGNSTMARIIGKAAMDAAEGKNDDEAASLRGVAYSSREHSGEAVLEAFDNMKHVFSRSMNNPYMAAKWDELTGGMWADI